MSRKQGPGHLSLALPKCRGGHIIGRKSEVSKENSLGETRINFKIYGPDSRAEVEAIVDTGATFTKIPESLASKLKLEAKYEVSVEMGNGKVITRKLAIAEVEVEGSRKPIPVTIGGEGERKLLGYTTLEILGFKVNPVTGKIEKAIAVE
jgi:predicted aspartyl protease